MEKVWITTVFKVNAFQNIVQDSICLFLSWPNINPKSNRLTPPKRSQEVKSFPLCGDQSCFSRSVRSPSSITYPASNPELRVINETGNFLLQKVQNILQLHNVSTTVHFPHPSVHLHPNAHTKRAFEVIVASRENCKSTFTLHFRPAKNPTLTHVPRQFSTYSSQC